MIGFSILSNVFTNVLQTKFVNGIYHSVMMKPIEGGGTKPAAPVNGRWKYVGLDDTKGFSCYCRESGSADVFEREKLGGCNTWINKFQIPHRIVFFNASEKRDHSSIIASIIGAMMKTPGIKIQKLITIPEEILRSEAPTGRFQFKENTLYFSIEFFVLLELQTNTCDQEIKCEGVPNPFCE